MTTFTGFLIRRSQQAHVAAWQRVVSAEVTSVQFGVLLALDSDPGMSQRELCETLDLDRSTIAEIVTRLQRRGLIERERHAVDRRRNILTLSPTGRAELATLLPRVERVDEVLVGGMTPEDGEELRRLLSMMLETMDSAARR